MEALDFFYHLKEAMGNLNHSNFFLLYQSVDIILYQLIEIYQVMDILSYQLVDEHVPDP